MSYVYVRRGINFSIDKRWCSSRLRITIPYSLWLSVNKFSGGQSHHHASVGTSSPNRAAVVVASGVRTVDTISKTAVAASVASANATATGIVHSAQPAAYQVNIETVGHMKGS